jgi:serine protease Do
VSRSAGIVSAIPRYFPELPGIPMIQSDVAINRGSSGGPLFNLRGEVIGMNALIFSEDGGYAGVSFALPVDIAMGIAAELRERGYVARSRLGARVQEVTPDLASAFGLAQSVGALITRVDPGSPAQSAGLRGGDIVLGIGARRDMSSFEIQQLVTAADPRRALELNVWRAGQVLRITTRVTAAPLDPADTFVAPRDESGEPRLGLRLVEIGAAERRVLGLEGGVRVAETGGAAQRAGILPHDLILAVNEVPVAKIAEFDAALARRPADRPAALLVKRGSSLSYVAVQPNRAGAAR